MDVKHMLNQLDQLYNNGQFKQAETLIDNCIIQAMETHNYGAALTFYNELEGLYRTTGRAPEAADVSDKALQLIDTMGLNGTVHHATTLLNGATANRWANNIDKALEMYLQAAEIYHRLGEKNSYLVASLYNNISHIYQQKNQHHTALEHLETALDIVSNTSDSAGEIATTQVTMTLSYMALENMEKAHELLECALGYYQSEQGLNDGHYGSCLSAYGEYLWRTKEYDKAIDIYEKALQITHSRFGENEGCRVIKHNLEIIRKEKSENQII